MRTTDVITVPLIFINKYKDVGESIIVQINKATAIAAISGITHSWASDGLIVGLCVVQGIGRMS